MEYALVCGTALVAAALTLVSGFGLGTLLLPAFAVFFPLPIAVGATAVVHLANNVFKVLLVGRDAHLRVVAAFGLPAAAAAFAGAWILELFAGLPPLARYTLAGRTLEVAPVELLVASLIFAFALADLLRWFEGFSVDRRWVPVGGLLSGFFGGISGHQGALRSAFLVRLGLGRDGFIGTGVLCAVLVDVSRLIVYGIGAATLPGGSFGGRPLWGLVGAAVATAFLGSWIGARLVKKVTLRTVEVIVGAGLLILAVALGAGLI